MSWTTALDLQFAALKNGRQCVRDLAPTEALHQAELDAVAALPVSETFAWSADITQAVWGASLTVPATAILGSASITHPSEWWWFEWPLPVPMTDPELASIASPGVDAILLTRIAEGGINALLVTEFRHLRTGQGPIFTGFFVLIDGASIDQISRGQGVNPKLHTDPLADPKPVSPRVKLLSRFIAAASAWMQQRVVLPVASPVERHWGKRLARDYHVERPRRVQVVQLRRPVSKSMSSLEGHTPAWSCRWLVGGHWRNQPYKDTQKLIYILPYVKGPADQPFRAPVRTVYEVNR